ncbi:MAG: DUF1800 domain-containing protein [Gammaproteobacteria bacterium]
MIGIRVISIAAWCFALCMPSVAHALSIDEARHLLTRTGFGAPWAEVDALRGLSREAAVDRLLGQVRREAITPAPDLESLRATVRVRDMSEDQKRAIRRERRAGNLALMRWWYREMLDTPSPLTERMTLFWHNHFTSSLRKVKNARLLLRQNQLLRQHALGRFDVLLHDITRDAAMIRYLDGQSNRKGAPNENFARELMELFTLGEGRFSESDVREAARAFTGWVVNREGRVRFLRGRHDYGSKTVLGARGRFDGTQLINLLLRQQRTAEHVTEKLWREFVSPDPDPEQVNHLAGILRDRGYDITALMRALLLSEDFWAPENRGVLIKSPVELMVGTIRQLEINIVGERRLVAGGKALGQVPFSPPNVRGWPGHTAWITSDTLLARQRMVDRLLRRMGTRRGTRLAPPPVNSAGLARWLLAVPAVDEHPGVDDRTQTIAQLLSDPAYQLK